MIKILLDAKSPLNATDVDGMTALHHAVCEGHGDAALLLLTMGADFEKEDRDGKRPLDLVPDAKVGLGVKLEKNHGLMRYRHELSLCRQQSGKA
jgi:ankyrin repeat protein